MFFISFVLCGGIVFAVDSTENQDQTEQTIELTASDNNQNPEKKFVMNANSTNVTNVKKTPGIFIFIRVVLVLAIVIVCIYFVMNFMRKSVNGDADTNDPYLRKVAQVTLAPGKTVQIVTLLEKGYVLGVTDNNISLLSEIDDKELLNAMNISADKNSKDRRARNFSEVLEMFLPSKSSSTTSATKTNIYSESSESVSDFVKTQRRKLNKNKE